MAATYKRGKIWWGRVQRHGREFRRSFKTTNKAVAERRLKKWVEDLDAITPNGEPAYHFNVAAEKFAAEHCTTLRPQAARRYAVSLMHLVDAFSGLKLHEITSAKLWDFEMTRRAKGVKAPTIRRDLACLSSLFGCAIEWEWINANPIPVYMARRRRMGLKEAAPRTRYLTRLEEIKLLAAATPEPRKAIQFAIDTGLRREEQFSLTWKMVDLDLKRLIVTGKGGKTRAVPFIGRVGTILAQIRRHIRSPYVFWHGDGRRYNNMEKALKAAARRAGLEKPLQWHDLRRTFGCRRIQDDGLIMEQVQLLLGHGSVTVTERGYAFLKVDDVERALTKTGTGAADSK